MLKSKTLLVLFCIALAAVLCLSGTADAGSNCRDRDGDSYYNQSGCGSAKDCDDHDPEVNPDADEDCTDGIDNDCDDLIDQDDPDAVDCPACTPTGLPDDNCDGVDDDCDETADDDYMTTPTTCGVGECAAAGQMECQNGTEVNTCSPGSPQNEGPEGDPTCGDSKDNDCDGDTDGNDSDCVCIPTGPDNNCDGIDNDCNGTADDGYSPSPTTCGVGACESTGQLECQNGTEVNTCSPGTPQNEGPMGDPTCGDSSDNDCDGSTDGADPDCQADCSIYDKRGPCDADPHCEWQGDKRNGVCVPIPVTCIDNDGDGYGVSEDPTCANDGIDCDDTNPAINPGADDSNCNGVDEDCSGINDDGYIPTPTTCGDGVCASTGQIECQSGSEVDSCTSGPQDEPTDVTCDGLDGDCDGQTDEDFASTPTNCGLGVCASTGDTTCVDGSLGDTCTAGPKDEPTDVTCDGIDGDCDGSVDEDYMTSPTTCDQGVCASTGQLECQSGSEVDTCTPGPQDEPTDVTCDGVDGDCDGSVDEDYVIDDTCGLGICGSPNNTPSSCVGGVETICAPGPAGTEGPEGDQTCNDTLDNDCDGLTDTPEDPDCQCIPTGQADDNCDGIDDDCNGTADDGYVPTPTTCGQGECAGNTGQLECQSGSEVDTCDPLAGALPDNNCDGLDNDCDGAADDDYITTPTTCGVGECAGNAGQIECQSGSEVDTCDPLAGALPDNNCDGLDNDCDGAADDDYITTPTTCGVGECSGNSGQLTCQSGNEVDDCDPIAGAAPDDSVCDGLDEDCDGSADEDYVPMPTTCGLGECESAGNSTCIGGVEDDNCTPGTPPEDPELTCDDNLDNDCDGNIDTSDNDCLDPDADNDNDTYSINQGDCDDTDPDVNPGAAEVCDGKDTNCDGSKPPTDVDDDLDGFPLCASDCNDNDPDIYPGAPEICDGKDNNCDYVIPLDERDADNDGFLVCDPVPDCDDNDSLSYPGAFEECNGVDNNCNTVPDDLDNCSCTDADGDGQLSDYITCGGTDCDNNDADVYLGAPEICTDDKDNDCDGLIDFLDPDRIQCPAECVDNDGDGYFVDSSSTGINCGPVDCDDNDPLVNPGEADICDGKDTDCDGFQSPADVDIDEDGVAQCAGDCDDGDPARFPGNLENPLRGNTCSDFIDNDCDLQVDIADQDCNGSCQTDTSPKDPPHIFTLLNPDDTVHPDNSALNCGKCHEADINNPTGSVTDPIRYACQRCHADPADDSNPLNGTTKEQYPLDLPYGYGSAPNVNLHVTWTADDKGCVVCHNPHAQEQNHTFGTDYGMYIKDYICYDPKGIEEFVEFTAPEGPNSFADGAPYTANVCDMCHTDTNHHQNDGTAPGGQSHNDGADCMQCHPHGDGFSPTGGTPAPPHDGITNCEYCHVSSSDFTSPIPDTKCDQCHTPAGALKLQFPVEYGTAPDVITHQGRTCVGCHEPMFGTTNLKHVRTDLSAVGGGTNIVFTQRTGTDSFADGPLYTENVCNTCHTMTNHHQNDGTAPGGQDHNNSTDCAACHPHGNGFSPDVEPPPAPHTSFDCEVCHVTTDTYVFDAIIPNSACLTCHDGSAATEAASHFTGMYCIQCHNPMRTQINFRGNENIKFIRTVVWDNGNSSNVAFEAYTGPYSFAADSITPPDMSTENYLCNTCHRFTNHHQADGIAPGGQSHNDGADCTVCHTHPGAFRDHLTTAPVPPPHDQQACETCHVTPDTYVPDAAIPNSACMSCHNGTIAVEVDRHFSDNYIDPTTGALLDTKCVECHNPMSVQSNQKFIRSTIRSRNTLYPPYVTGAPNYEGVCEVCHTQTNHHRNDGSAPAQSHNDGSNCGTCHLHIDGFQPDITVPTPHDVQACNTCHTAEPDYAAPVDNTACMSCHDGTGSTKVVQTHFSDNYLDPTTGALLSANCIECHNPMSVQSNLAFIRSSVRGSTVVFTAYTGPNSFADGDATYDGICEVCHTQTNHHRNDGSAPVQSHNDGGDCRNCHAHIDGYQPDVTAPPPHDLQPCESCHVTPDTYVPNADIPNTACLSCHDGTGSSLVVDTHFSNNYTDPTTGSNLSANCVECHNPMSVQSNMKFVRSTVRGSTVVFTAYTGANSFADGGAPYDGICEVCHTQTNHHRANGVNPGGLHKEQEDCRACHTHGAGYQDQIDNTVVPAPHNAVACTDCHVTPDTYVPDADIPNTACMSCHDGTSSTLIVDTHFSDTYTDPNTGALLSANCVECHNPMSVQTNFRGNDNLSFIRTVIRGADIVFEAITGPYSFADDSSLPADMLPENYLCNTCHTQTNHHRGDGTVPPGGQSHNDGTDCTVCHSHLGGFTDHISNTEVPVPHDQQPCESCHVTPDTYVPDAAIPNTACMSCHNGTGSTLIVDTHFSDTFTDPNTGALLSADCVECHNPMSIQTNFRGNDNMKFIRTSIRGSSIAFEAYTGPYSFADDSGIPGDMLPENYVCNTCHTQTNHHRGDGTVPPGGQSHHDSEDCRSCHTHLGGFTDQISNTVVPAPHDGFDCIVCHETPDTYVPNADILNTTCQACHDISAPGTASGGSDLKVDTHYSTSSTDPNTGALLDANCVECHNPMSVQTNYLGGTNLKFVRDTVRGINVAFEADTGANSYADGDAVYDGICEVCHTQTEHHRNDGTAPDMPHNNGQDCTTCHDHIDGFNLDPNDVPPAPHDGFDCRVCHDEGTYVLDAAIPNSNCQGCHDEAAPDTAGGGSDLKVDRHYSDNYIDPSTGSLMDIVCVECHNPMRPQTNQAFIRSTIRGNNAVYPPFVTGGPNYEGVCEVCHTQTNHHQNDGNAPGGQSHNNAEVCTTCHEHINGFIPSGECIQCHNGVPAGASYVTRDVVGVDFQQASRHVFGGTVSNWDCIVCHREGNEDEAAAGNVATTSLHNNGGTPVVDMRNVDTVTAGWIWDKNNKNDAMFSDMDSFCMGCHDLDGASGINVNATDDGVNLSNARSLTPFNSTDEVSAGTGGGTVNMAGYERLEVIDVATQFDPANPSHHAVLDRAYLSHNTNWGDDAWVDQPLKSGLSLITDGLYESAALHCADCHTVDSADGGAHGGASGFMLQAGSIDETCFICHNSNVYFDPDRDFRGISRWDHEQEGSVWDPADGSILGAYSGVEGSVCLNCHGGDPAVDGFGGIHGLPSGTDWRSGEERYRFQGGSYMSHSPSSWTETSGGESTCYFAPGNKNQAWSSCSQHEDTETGRTSDPNYSRGVPGDY